MVNNGWWTQPWHTEWSTHTESWSAAGAEGSDLWDNVTSMHVWQSNDAMTGADRGGFQRTAGGQGGWVIMGAAMSVNPVDGTLVSSHNEGGGATANRGWTRLSTNAADGSPGVAAFIDPIIHSNVFVNSVGDPWVVSNVIGRWSNDQQWNGVGGLFVRGPDGQVWSPVSTTGTAELAANNSMYMVQSMWYQGSTQNSGQWPSWQTTVESEQFRTPAVVTHRTPAGVEHIHAVYFCSLTSSIRYRYNLRGQATSGTAATNPWGLGAIGTAANATAVRRLWTNIDGRTAPDDFIASGAAVAWHSANMFGEGARVVDHARADIDTSRSSNAGEHNDVAVTSQGHPVIVYFCAESQVLRIAVSNDVRPIAGANWRIFEVFNGVHADNPRAFGTGHFVSMRIDTFPGPAQNTVHISAFNAANNNLVYIQGRIENNAWVFGHSVVVDSVGRNVGQGSAISLDRNGNPWISYFDNALVGGMDAVKVAFFDPSVFDRVGDTRALEDMFGAEGACGNLSGWETMHVPARFRVMDHELGTLWSSRLGMENFPTRNVGATGFRFWSAAVGFLSSDRYRVAYWVE